MRKARKASDDKDAKDTLACAMKLRVYPTPEQQALAGQWLHTAHKFRNEAVAFVQTRRRARGAWFHQHPVLAKHWIPEEFAGSDVLACSKWLTERLQAAREILVKSAGIAFSRHFTEDVAHAWAKMDQATRDFLPDGWLVTVPRTVLDQVLMDMAKTVAKAYKDRKNKLKKPAGFPVFQKWSYATSVRLQVEAAKNNALASHWEDQQKRKRKQLDPKKPPPKQQVYVPGLGALRFRDNLELPATPPKMITLSRNAANQWHVSFVCVNKETPAFQQAKKARKAALPLDPATGLPVAKGGDVGLRTTLTLSDGKSHARNRYYNRQKRRLRNLSRGMARKKRGSKRWQKMARQQGKTHAKIAAQRQAGLQEVAQAVVKSSAIIALEDLSLQGMLQHPTLAASAHDAALGTLKALIHRQAEKHGRLVLECGRFVPSTHLCGVCGQRHPKKLPLSATTWTCTHCFVTHERDANAARVILQQALEAGCQQLEQYSTAQESGAGTLPSPGSIPWSGLHPDLARFIARGGLTALRAEQARESRRIWEQVHLPPGPGLDGPFESRMKPILAVSGRKGAARTA